MKKCLLSQTLQQRQSPIKFGKLHLFHIIVYHGNPLDAGRPRIDGYSINIINLKFLRRQVRATCANDIDFAKCHIHQSQRSAGMASGVLKFAHDPNPVSNITLIIGTSFLQFGQLHDASQQDVL